MDERDVEREIKWSDEAAMWGDCIYFFLEQLKQWHFTS